MSKKYSRFSVSSDSHEWEMKNLSFQSKCCFFLPLYVPCFYFFYTYRKSNHTIKVEEPFKKQYCTSAVKRFTEMLRFLISEKTYFTGNNNNNNKGAVDPNTAVNIWAVTSSEFMFKELLGWCSDSCCCLTARRLLVCPHLDMLKFWNQTISSWWPTSSQLLL